MPRNNQRTDVSRQELQRLEARLTSLAGRTARQASDSDELPVDAVDTVNIANDAVTEDKIADGAVTFKKLASGGTTSGGGGNYSSQAETRRSGATTTTEIYYTARPDGDGYAESEVDDGGLGAGESSRRRLYYSDKFDADPDTAGDWTAYTTQPADDTAYATCKASLLAGLSDTDGTANTRGTLPVSLKMERTVVTPLLLDTYSGATAAYSVRLLRTAYSGNALRVREDSGNTETDIGFDSNGDLDTAAIATHCGSANGYVVTWYDQSGNANNATQSTTTQQPQIYNGTAVLTRNGKPAPDFDGSNDQLGFDASTTTQPFTWFGVVQRDDTTNSVVVGWNVFSFVGRYEANDFSIYAGSYVGSSGFNSTAQQMFYAMFNGSSSELAVNGGTAATGNAGTRDMTGTGNIGGDSSGGMDMQGGVQELVLWASDQSTNRSGIESNINTYFSIY